MEKIKVLNIVEVLEPAGIESYLMNTLRNIDREKIQYDFLVTRNRKEFYDEEIIKLGSNKFTIDCSIKNRFIRDYFLINKLKNFLKQNQYDIVHIHACTTTRMIFLKTAKDVGVKKRIYHSHSAFISKKRFFKYSVYNFYRKKYLKYSTELIACSNKAGEWMFGENEFTTICNSIDVDKFKYNEIDRINMRKRYDVRSNEFVICNIGRLSVQKNQSFLIKVLILLNKIDACFKLMIIGKGELLESLIKQAEENNIYNKLILINETSEIEKFLSMSDIYAMPSLYEGLPVSAIEAQCNGLPCFFSNKITKETQITDRVNFCDLSSVDLWVENILSMRNKMINIDRLEGYYRLLNSEYDMQKSISIIEEIYGKETHYDE